MPTARRYADAAKRQAAYRRRQAEARTRALTTRGVPALPGVATIPGHPRWEALTRQADLLLRTTLEEMQAYYDQRSESWQESERGAEFLERVQAIEEAQAALEELLG
jgi:hypothetical protein